MNDTMPLLRGSDLPMTTMWTERGSKRVVFTDGSYFPSLFNFITHHGDMKIALESMRDDAMWFNRFIALKTREVQLSGDQQERDNIVKYIETFGHGCKAFMLTYSIKDKKLDWVIGNILLYHQILTQKFQDPDFTVSDKGVLESLSRDR